MLIARKDFSRFIAGFAPPEGSTVRKDSKRHLTGFTLIELIIVVVIMGILVSISIPTYRGVMERGYGDRAKVVLKTIHVAQKMYRLDYNDYCSSVSGANGLAAKGYLANPNLAADKKFTYGMLIPTTKTTFTVRATRDSGSYSGGWIQIRQDGKFRTGSPWPFTYQPSY